MAANSIKITSPREDARLMPPRTMAASVEATGGVKDWVATVKDGKASKPIKSTVTLVPKQSGAKKFRWVMLLEFKTPLQAGRSYRLTVEATLEDDSTASDTVSIEVPEPEAGVLAALGITSPTANQDISAQRNNFVAYGSRDTPNVTSATMNNVSATMIFNSSGVWYATFPPLAPNMTWTLTVTDASSTSVQVTGLKT